LRGRAGVILHTPSYRSYKDLRTFLKVVWQGFGLKIGFCLASVPSLTKR